MCGRFTSTAERAAIAERFAARLPEALTERYNVSPAQGVLTIRRGEDDERLADIMRWGLVPHWARDASIGYKMINARAETVAEKRTYRKLLTSRRCLIPADGFYEWRRGSGGGKMPVRFTLADGDLFAFAGLWTSWVDKETGELLDSCTIVTTTPNELVAGVHNRMPVILPAASEDGWLDPELALADVLALLVPYPADLMRAHAVSRLVNAGRNEGPEILVPDPGDEEARALITSLGGAAGGSHAVAPTTAAPATTSTEANASRTETASSSRRKMVASATVQITNVPTSGMTTVTSPRSIASMRAR